jgi:hypothetical protein
MDDITRRGNVVRFALDETFLRADTMARLLAIEKMLTLDLITVDEARALEELSPDGLDKGIVNVTNV